MLYNIVKDKAESFRTYQDGHMADRCLYSKECAEMILKKTAAVITAAAAIGAFAVSASAECNVDYSTGVIKWTFESPDTAWNNKNEDFDQGFYSYTDGMTRIGDDETDALAQLSYDKLIMNSTQKKGGGAHLSVGGGILTVNYEDSHVYIKAPADGEVAIVRGSASTARIYKYGGNSDYEDITKVTCKKDEIFVIDNTGTPSGKGHGEVSSITFTPDKSTQYFTLSSQNGMTYKAAGMTMNMYGKTKSGSVDIPEFTAGEGTTVAAAVSNVPSGAEITAIELN